MCHYIYVMTYIAQWVLNVLNYTDISSGSVVFSHSVVSDSVTPWTVAHQAPLSMGILQARVLEWVVMPSSSQPKGRTQVSCIAGRFFTDWVTRETHKWCQKGWVATDPLVHMLASLPRMQNPLSVSFLRVIFVVNYLEDWGNMFYWTKSRLASIC